MEPLIDTTSAILLKETSNSSRFSSFPSPGKTVEFNMQWWHVKDLKLGKLESNPTSKMSDKGLCDKSNSTILGTLLIFVPGPNKQLKLLLDSTSLRMKQLSPPIDKLSSFNELFEQSRLTIFAQDSLLLSKATRSIAQSLHLK
mmetsp:Transcript_23598/g.51285  ORF Transcript_23598/g.51285 Transcript_23598/m.51285 type:complete len:143 (-) Transcript_23598:340-768(-)